MRRDVFQAIADPTRRAIIHLVAQQPLNLNAVAENFDVSRPAISKHMKILAECGLITIRQEGRERYCAARLEKLDEVTDWVEQHRKFWNAKLDALENYINRLQEKKKGKDGNNKVSGKKSSRELKRVKPPIRIKKKRVPLKKQNHGKQK